jgi:hypothetical protein
MAERYFANKVKLDAVTAYVEYLKDTLLIVQTDMVFTPIGIGSQPYVIISYFNDVPTLTAGAGTLSYEAGSATPEYVTASNTSTFVTVADGDSSTGYTLVADSSAEDMDTVGTFPVLFTVTDAAGNVSDTLTVTFTITADITNPVIADAETLVVTYVTGDAVPATWLTGITASDNLDGDVTSSIVVTDTAVDMVTVGTFAILYNVDDTAGNSATQLSKTITITAS